MLVLSSFQSECVLTDSMCQTIATLSGLTTRNVSGFEKEVCAHSMTVVHVFAGMVIHAPTSAILYKAAALLVC